MIVCFAVLFAVAVSGVRGQFLSLRACTANSSVVASRNAGASNTAAVSACSTFCGNSSNSGTYLFSYFCSTPLGSAYCLYANSYENISPLNSAQTQVPTLTANTSSVDVPCGFGNTPVAALFGFSSPGSQNWVVNQQVISSTPADSTVGYIAVDPVNGTVYRGTVGPPVDTTQTIAFTLSQTGTAVYSNTVNVTFTFRSCALQISGPSLVNIYACCYYDDYSALRFTITNPNIQNTPVYWDFPSLYGMPDPPLSTYQASVPPLYAPDILTNSVPLGADNDPSPGFNYPPPSPPDNDLFIVSCNLNRGGGDATGPVGFYCSNPSQGYFMLGCQQLLISATPLAGGGPLQAGKKLVTVCGYGNSNDGGRYCGAPGTTVVGLSGGQQVSSTTFTYSGTNLPPGVTGGTLNAPTAFANPGDTNSIC